MRRFKEKSSISCPLCDSFDVRYYATHPKAGQKLYKCRDCRFYFVFPRRFELWDPAEAEAARPYMRWREVENSRIAEFILNRLNRERPLRLLEIGFGDGPLTELLLGEVDEYWGIEPIPMAFERAVNRLRLNRDKCFPIRAEELDTHPAFAAQTGAFDVIVMVSVFEHLSNPVGVLRSCSRLLRPSGILILSTPDSQYFRELRALRRVARMDPWSYTHISFFTEENLEKTFDRHNLVIKERTYSPLVTRESILFFGVDTSSRAISAAMRIFMNIGLDRALRIHTLFYVLQNREERRTHLDSKFGS